jgi:hypothetical protein
MIVVIMGIAATSERHVRYADNGYGCHKLVLPSPLWLSRR